MRLTTARGSWFRRFLVLFVLAVYVVPILWMYVSAMRTDPDFLARPVGIPTSLNPGNFVRAYQMADMTHHFGISIVVTAATTAIVVLFASLAAYSFSRLRYRGKNVLFGIFFLGLILPVQSYLVGLFVLFRSLGLLNTMMAMILPNAGMGLAIAIVIMKYYFDALPSTLEESAYMDGASTFLVYRRIVMPISAAIVITVSIFTTITAWNEFLIPFVMIQNQRIRPLTTSLFVFATRFSAQYTLLFAALSIVVTPMFIIYFVFQKQVQAGITAGALKE